MNDALQALASNSSGPTAPAATYANQTWYDTANDRMMIRNEANSGWITQYTIAATYLDIPDIRRNGSQVFSRDNIVGTVTQSGGVPTGAIVQRGTNANGEFIRYADGTQICWDSATTTNAISTADGTLFALAASINRTFATAFLTGTIPAVIPSAGRTGGGSVLYATVDATPTDTGVNLMLTSPSNLTTSVTKRWNYTAFGRWF